MSPMAFAHALRSSDVPAGTTAITFSARFRLPSLPSTSQIIFTQGNTGFDVEVLNNGTMRFNVRDGAAVKVLNNTIVAAGILAAVWYDLVCSIDQVSKTLWVRLNGTLIATVAFTTAGNGLFQSNRALGFLARGGGTLQFIGNVEYLKTWLSATGTGAEPASAPLKTIVGPAAAANSDGWKLGTNAT